MERVNFLRRHRWWLLPELTVVAVLGVVLIYVNAGGLDDELSARAQAVLEQQSPADLELISTLSGHGAPETGGVLCVTEPFGTDPADPEKIEDVRVIYTRYLCALVQKGMPWDYATRSTGPAVITLTDPPTVRLARSGAGYPERVRELFPDELESEAFAGFNDRARPSNLLNRYVEAIS
jgi:hypothetical protein